MLERRQKNSHQIETTKMILLGAIIVAFLLALPILCSRDSSALTYQSTTDVSFTFGSTISVDVSSDTLSINNLNPGSSSDSNIITVSVATNASHGYTLTATAGTSSTNTDLVNTDNNNYKFSSIATNASLASLTADNTWGYSISTNNGTNWSNYSGLPKDNDDEGATGKELINTNNPADSKSIQFKIGAKASTSQAAGTYTNVINFYAVSRPEPKTIANSTYMHEVESCPETIPEGQVYTLIDSRDQEQYKVARLADGNCWMLDNLRLDPSDSTTLTNITADNTNASTTSLNYFKNGGGTTSDQYATAKINNVAWTSSSQNYYSIPMTISTYKDQTTTGYGNGSRKIGVYYNYCAASAGSYCYGNGTNQGTSTGDATEDLCPSGWRMPTGGSSGEYKVLYTAYLSNQADYRAALSTPLSGYFEGGSTQDRSGRGFFWSSTRSYDYSMYNLHVTSSTVNTDNSGNSRYGQSMRCVLN